MDDLRTRSNLGALAPGEFTVLIGPSGCSKSTLRKELTDILRDADPGPSATMSGPRVCTAALRAAVRPGNEGGRMPVRSKAIRDYRPTCLVSAISRPSRAERNIASSTSTVAAAHGPSCSGGSPSITAR